MTKLKKKKKNTDGFLSCWETEWIICLEKIEHIFMYVETLSFFKKSVNSLQWVCTVLCHRINNRA